MTTKKPVKKPVKKATKKATKKPVKKRWAPVTDEQENIACLQRAIDEIRDTECLVLIEVGKDGATRIRHNGSWANAIGSTQMALDGFRKKAQASFKTFDPIKGDR